MDTNVWLFLYGPSSPGDSRVEVYSEALSRILKASSRIYTNVLIISEFISSYTRMRHRIAPSSSKKFKEFRKSADFKPVAEAAAADAKRVLAHCTNADGLLTMLSLEPIIDEFAAGDTDFNDQILASLCRETGWTLVTDDGDFRAQALPILTANQALIS